MRCGTADMNVLNSNLLLSNTQSNAQHAPWKARRRKPNEVAYTDERWYFSLFFGLCCTL